MKDFLAQAAKLLKKNKQYRRQMVVFLCLAVVVTFGTVTALKLYGQAMTHQVEVLDCQYKVHEHTEECYDRDENGNLGTEPVCGYALYAIHTHNDACYDAKGNLVCALEEHEKHEHKEECYLTEKVLVCELEETEVTVPPEEDAEASEETPEAPEETPETPEETPEETEAPAGEEPPAEPEAPSGEEAPAAPPEPAVPEGPICGKEPHTHGEGCYEDAIVCGFAEEHAHGEGCATQTLACTVAEHAHGDGCTDEEGNMTCTLEEHAHQEGCYTQEMTCGKEEHTHAEGCHAQNLVCTLEEHEHIESCYAQAPAAPAQGSAEAPTAEGSGSLEECAETGEGHIHTEECYEEVTTLVCGELELHTHDDSCYSEECFDEEGKLIEGSRVSCELLQLEEHIHVHTEGEDSCFKTVELTPEEVAALENGAKLHIHEDSCYDEEGNLICGHDANHVHMPQCYDDAGKLICGYGTAVHVHEDKCYDEEKNLICGYETAEHPHDESCYDAEGNLQCGYETAAHVHEDSCYDEEGNVICGYEAASHVHEDSCYDAEGNLICGYETEVHVHEDSCYDAEGNLICGYETAKHVHEESCYDADGNVICGYEAAAHVHEDSCYDEEGNLVCGYEAASHPHTEDCYDEEGNLICGYETATHVHNENCYDEEGNVICGYAAEIHEHDEDCYDAEGNLICGYNKNGSALDALYCNELIHQHDEDCNDEAGNLICGKADFAAHTHTDECYNVEGKKICPLPEREAHVHSEECYPEGAAEGEEPSCGKEEIALHTHTDECYDAEGVPTCGETEVLEHVHSEDCKVSNQPVTKIFENESFIITAVYNRDANIPEEAELLAEQITEESNGEHYAKRQAEYQEALGDDMATMRALLKIGFYVNGQEVEPESPVTITIQFLNEDGLAEGKPITVIHFVEDGTELLEGSKVEDGSTTFEMESFSEIAVGYGVENVRVPVDTAIDYDMDALHITFRIEGELVVPVDRVKNGDENNDIDEQLADSGSESTEENQNDVSHEEGERSTKIKNEEDSLPIDENTFIIPLENQNLEKNLEFKVETLSEDSEEYANAVAGADSISEADEILLLDVLSYSVVYDDEKLDLSDCTVTIEIAPTQMLVDYTEEVAGSIATLELDEQLSQEDLLPEVVITALKGQSESAKPEIMDAMVVNSDTVNESISFVQESESDNNTVAVAVTMSQANPPFHVEYWAYLDRTVIGGVRREDGSKGEVPTNARKALDVIDTAGKGVPKNGRELATTKIFLDAVGNVISEEKLTQVYSKRDYEYILAPNLTYFDALLENESYILKEVWTLDHDHDKDACYEKSDLICDKTHEHEWGCYKQTLKCSYANPSAIPDAQWKKSPYWFCTENHEHNDKCAHLRFTNRRETAEGESSNEYVLISWDKAIRLIYDTTDKNGNLSSIFYDYDISNGGIRTDGTAKIIETGSQGINSTKNCNAKVKYAFGNNNAGTNYGTTMWNGNELNKFNSKGEGYKGCTFELVSGTDGNKNVVFNVDAPVVFGEGDSAKQIGKTIFTQYGLDFNQSGDTYTLTGVSKNKGSTTVTGNLDKFINTTGDIWSNNFWPMDDATSWGGKGHDMKFGNRANKDNLRYEPGSTKYLALPVSDDGLDHNSYFGMHFAVTFELTEEYVGPLEYLFFGDDDMWVFLDDNTLVCDIGGVHSSVGEYVNLWDYLEKGSSGKHTLKFFYTERGASGSSCWMQFTLPSVTGFEPSQGYGELKIEKTAENFEAGKDFSFDIKFSDADGNELRNDYAYTKYQKTIEIVDGKEVEGSKVVENDIIIWNGGHFTLKDNEYIVITFLPIGTKYTITEADSGNCYTDIVVDGVKKENLTTDKTAEGSISSESQGKVSYRNYRAYGLPETGGSGTAIIYTMASVIVLLGGAGFLYKKKFRERRG